MRDDAGPTLGTLIRQRRIEKGWTQEELAERLASLGDEPIRQSYISRIERGQVQLPRRERLERFAITLDLSLVDLLLSSRWLDEEAGAIGQLDEVHGAVESAGDAPYAQLDLLGDPTTQHQLRTRLGILVGYAELLHEDLHERNPDLRQARSHARLLLNAVYGFVDDLQQLLESDGGAGEPQPSQDGGERQVRLG